MNIVSRVLIVTIILAISITGFAWSSHQGTGSLSQSADQTQEKVYEPKDVDQKARITKKPEPQYTEQARRKRTSGWVVLRLVLKSSGEIGDIKVIRDAPDGLTEECVRVAREIKFVPAMKDGNRVSQYIKVEYSFDTF